MREVEIVSNRR